MSFERLIREHDQIDAFCNALEAISLGATPDAYAVADAQFKLRQALDDHFAHEEEDLYARLMGVAGSSGTEIEHFDKRLRQLCGDWTNYLAEWTPECLEADWETFGAETVSLMRRVRERTAEETKLIYGKALHHSLISLRESRTA